MRKHWVRVSAVSGAMALGVAGLLLGAGAKNESQTLGPDRAKIQAAAKEATVVFTAKVTEVKVTGQEPTKPPSTVMEVTMQDRTMLKVPRGRALDLSATSGYQAVDGQDFVPKPGERVIVIGRAMPITGQVPNLVVGWRLVIDLMASATDANMAAIREALGLPADRPTSGPSSRPASGSKEQH